MTREIPIFYSNFNLGFSQLNTQGAKNQTLSLPSHHTFLDTVEPFVYRNQFNTALVVLCLKTASY